LSVVLVMTVKGKIRPLMAAVIALLIVAADQATKQMVLDWVPLNGGYEVIPEFMNIVHARNPGSAFGILSSRWFLLAVSVFAVLVIGWLVVESKELTVILLAGYSLFLGGALGNLVDRIRFGEVIDFLDVYVGNFHWPAFNVADSALCLGTACFFIHVLTKKSS
jgi:signal peptidase II